MLDRISRRFSIALAGLTLSSIVAAAPAEPPVAPPLSFNRDIRPILSENCYTCHGPDAKQRKARLRLDLRAEALKPAKSGAAAIVPSDITHSELLARITTDDADEHMPPAETGKKLSATQIALLRRWIQEGAEYQGLWSFIPPVRPRLPEVTHATWPKNPIDRFILARLDREQLTPSPEADRPTLIRRLYLDLLGLPPAPAEVDAFVNDPAPDAYEKIVDRLLANPHYGERMALEWLDAARFADTHGYHIDSARDMTAWRDWVINAFNTNKPFDQFTVEQIAGDLLPGATTDQRVASGFHRNNMVNFEGGAIAEEYLTAYNVDRVNTTGAVWLGLTIGCCQCHDHKYDPLTQKDFYQFYAFFNGVAEKGLDGSKGNAVPTLQLPTPGQTAEVARRNANIAALQQQFDAPNAAWDAAQAQWEREEATRLNAAHAQWVVAGPQFMKSAGGATLNVLDDKSVLVTGDNPDTDTITITVLTPVVSISGIKVEFLPDDSMTARGPGRSINGNVVLTEVRVGTAAPVDPADVTPVKIASVAADFSQDNFPAANAIDGKPGTGWAVYPQTGKPHSLTLVPEKRIESRGGGFLAITLEFNSGFARHTAGRIRISATSAKDPLGNTRAPIDVSGLLFFSSNQRSAEQNAKLRTWFRENVSPEAKLLREELTKARKALADYEATVRTTQVMADLDKPRETFILLRGQYDKHGDKVTASTPAALPPLPTMPAGVAPNRLALARWLVDPANPLTARVIVNRYWQMYFGTGLVKTAEDFGVQGEFPTHPELLDWLATEFVATQWNVKAMQRLIVTSATYRQSSRMTPEQIARDPENRLLSHGPRFRLPAEFVRDQALAISGLLNADIGGKSVLPYQPPGLWEELMVRSDGEKFSAQTYVQDHGQDLYRRGLYTFRKRTNPPPSLTTFDAPDRETCTVRRGRTNTPLQALVLLNDPTYVEASRKLAERAMTDGGATTDERITYVFRLATARAPKPPELAILNKVLDRQRDLYGNDSAAAQKLLSVGESKRADALDPIEHAAWTMLCSAILNLDETVTRN